MNFWPVERETNVPVDIFYWNNPQWIVHLSHCERKQHFVTSKFSFTQNTNWQVEHMTCSEVFRIHFWVVTCAVFCNVVFSWGNSCSVNTYNIQEEINWLNWTELLGSEFIEREWRQKQSSTVTRLPLIQTTTSLSEMIFLFLFLFLLMYRRMIRIHYWTTLPQFRGRNYTRTSCITATT